jgi:SAM-dependent methyltransferase
MPTLAQIARRLPPYAAHLGFRTLQAASAVPEAARYLRDRREYQRLPGAEPLALLDSFPKLTDRVLTSPFDAHYLHQDTWTAQRVAEQRPDRHVDVASRVELPCFLTSFTQVTYVDIRPLEAAIDGLESIAGSVLEMPYADQSLASVSCLHVTEHIGLGRYGDPLDPLGSRKAIAELQRVVAPGGHLYFSLPVGRPRVCFNAHRVHDPTEIVGLLDDLTLVEFAGVDDDQVFRRHRRTAELEGASYACGMYHLTRPAS